MAEPRILGLDAGFTAMGCVVVEGERVLHAEVLCTQRSPRKRGVRVADDDAERCTVLARGLLRLIRAWAPAAVVVELPHGGAQGARAARAMGMATGVVAAVLEATGLPAAWVTPREVKVAAAGRAGADKAAVRAGVLEALRWPGEVTEHLADAAGAVMAARDGAVVRAVMARERRGGVGVCQDAKHAASPG